MPADTDGSAPPPRSGRTRPGLPVVLFVVYLVLLVWIVLWKLDIPWIGAAASLPRPIKLVPFVPSGDAGWSAPTEVVANLLLFVPFGLHLGILAPRWRVGRAAGVFAGASAALEIAQHLLSVGSFDITDVVVNTCGGLVGFGLIARRSRSSAARNRAVATRVGVVGTAVGLLAVGVFVASPLHVAQQHDVVVVPTPGGL